MKRQEFRKMRSTGWLWPLLIAAAMSASVFWLLVDASPTLAWILALSLGAPTAAYSVAYFRIRYVVAGDNLSISSSPFLKYEIPLDQIVSGLLVSAKPSFAASFRVPGLALYTVHYPRLGPVKMCSTRMSDEILIIETISDKFGISPENPTALMDAIGRTLTRSP